MDKQLTEALQEANLSNYFNSLAISHQKEYLNWINEAKKPETRIKRIYKMIEMLKAKQN